MDVLVGRLPGKPVTVEAAGEAAADLAREFEARMADSSTLAFHVAYSVLRNRQDAEDVAQDAFIQAHRAFARLRDRDRFRSWLTRMTWRLAINHRRGSKNRAAREDKVAVRDIVESHEGALLEGERAKRLWSAIDTLPEKLRLVVVLAAIEEHSVKDVAALIEVPEGTVKSRLFEARQKLQEILR